SSSSGSVRPRAASTAARRRGGASLRANSASTDAGTSPDSASRSFSHGPGSPDRAWSIRTRRVSSTTRYLIAAAGDPLFALAGDATGLEDDAHGRRPETARRPRRASAGSPLAVLGRRLRLAGDRPAGAAPALPGDRARLPFPARPAGLAHVRHLCGGS